MIHLTDRFVLYSCSKTTNAGSDSCSANSCTNNSITDSKTDLISYTVTNSNRVANSCTNI
jgi:hypothetical protein